MDYNGLGSYFDLEYEYHDYYEYSTDTPPVESDNATSTTMPVPPLEAPTSEATEFALAEVRQGEHPHHPRAPSLPKGVVISDKHMVAIYQFLLDMNFSSYS